MEKTNTKKQIEKNMTFAQIMESHPDVADKLAEKGMFCCGCPMAMMETLEQGCEAHGVDADKLIKELNN